MHKYNRVFNIIAVLIFVGLFWVIALFLTFTLPKEKDSLKDLLPEDVEIVLSVNADQLIKTLLFDALYKTDFNEDDLTLLDRGKQSKQAQSFGILLNSEIVIFYDLWNKKAIQGFLFNISNDKAFDKLKLNAKNHVKKSNGKQAVILNLSDNASEELMEYATQFAEEVINSKKHSKKRTTCTEMMSLQYKGNEHTYIQNLDLDLKLEDEKILICGTGKKNNALDFSVGNYNMLTQSPKERCFEFQTGQLPDSIYKYFKIVFDELNITVPEVTSQQMMIYGVSIENINGSTTILPKFDWIIRFDSIVNLEEQLGALKETTDKMKIVDKQSIKVGGTKYFYKQISEHEIYIGVTESPEIKNVKTQILPLMRGNPSVLLEIEGKGIIAQFINVMPQVKNTRSFMESVAYFDIHMTEDTDEDLKIDGEIRLKEGKMMSVEMVKFVLLFVK